MCIKIFIFYFWDLLYSAMGKCSLSHAPAIKTRTTAKLSLKKGTIGSRKDQLLYMCCFCQLGLVAIARLQWKYVLKFMWFSEIVCWIQTQFRIQVWICLLWLIRHKFQKPMNMDDSILASALNLKHIFSSQ